MQMRHEKVSIGDFYSIWAVAVAEVGSIRHQLRVVEGATSLFERAPVDGPACGPRQGRLRERGFRVAGGRERETHTL